MATSGYEIAASLERAIRDVVAASSEELGVALAYLHERDSRMRKQYPRILDGELISYLTVDTIYTVLVERERAAKKL